MSTQPTDPAGGPSEEELRAAYEAELSRITTTDMIAQSAVSLLNLGARKLQPAPAAEASAAPGGASADLEQVRDAIDGARALLDILDRRIPQELRPLRDALSQLQMAYAREMQSASTPQAAKQAVQPEGGEPAAQPAAGAAGTPKSAQEGDAAQQQPGPGPAESSGRLWVPGR